MKNRSVERRIFLTRSVDTGLRVAAASSLSSALSRMRAADPSASKSRPKVCIFTEHFQSLPIPEVCRIFKRIGVDGLDLTVRPGGHIEPEDAKTELPKAAQVARDVGLEVMMLTTGITTTDHHAEEILATCNRLGIDRIKLGYYGSGTFGTLAREMSDVRRRLDVVVKLAAKYGVRPCVHVHSGETIPSNGFLLYQMIRDIPPDRIGAFLDSYHMTMTGGAGGWRQAIDLLTPWISLVALKNFRWERLDRDELGQQRWRTNYCRLEDGIAPIPDFVRTIHKTGYRGFYTLHTEYRLGVKDCIRLTEEDFVFLRKVLARL